MRDDAEYRLMMIEQFKNTLDQIEWKEKLKEGEKIEKERIHIEFIDKLREEKMFK